MGRTHTDEQVAERREAVERVCTRGAWSRAMVVRLAKQFDVSPRTIYDDRNIVAREWGTILAAKLGSTVDAKAELMAEAREVQREAFRSGELNVALRTLDFKARVLGAYEPMRVSLEAPIDSLSDIEKAREVLHPDSLAWARAVLIAAGEPIPGVIDVPVLDVTPPDE